MVKINEHQLKQLKDLRSGKEFSYQDASIYTVLLDLVQGSGIDEVFIMLHNVAFDLDKREEFESLFDNAKNYKW